MDIGAIDRSATRGGGPVRGAAPVTKLVAMALMLAAVIVSWNLLVLAAALALLLAAVRWGRIDMRLALTLAAYPAVFALVFAFSATSSLLDGAVLVLKAVTAALAAVTVVLSTPYPQVFAPVQRIVPGLVGDALLMTYRTTFILLEKFSRLLRASRLRAGLRLGEPVRAARATAGALGGLLLYSVDLAQRDYDVMRLRGYERRLRVSPQRSLDRRADAVLLAGAAAMLGASVLWRLGAQSLNPYTWLVLIAPVGLLVLATVTGKEPE